MRLGFLGVISIIGFSLALTGCGYSCEDLCEDEAECSGSTTNPEDCDPTCELIERRVEDFGCEDDFDELLSCYSEQDICDEEEALDACSDESEKFNGCMSDYCEDHRESDDCGGAIEANDSDGASSGDSGG